VSQVRKKSGGFARLAQNGDASRRRGVSSNAIPNSSGNWPDAAMEEIVVTARRREESLQQVPMAISAFDQTPCSARGSPL